MPLSGAPLFLHADDFGMSRCITDGIIDALAKGVLTSTSVLMNAPQVEYSLGRWNWLEEERCAGRLQTGLRRQCGDTALMKFDLGVHLNLTQGRPITAGYPSELLDQHGCFAGIGTVFRKLWSSRERWRSAIQSELAAQISRLIDYGIRPTHLNGHQYVSLVPLVSSLIPELMQRFEIRVVRVALERNPWNALLIRGHRVLRTALSLVKRHYASRFHRLIQNAGIAHPAQFFGTSHAGRIQLPVLQRFLESAVPEASCEIGLHPGRQSEQTASEPIVHCWADPLRELRPFELQLLLDPSTAELIQRSGRQLGRLQFLC
ncbi:MAG: carbohydrate deacetylase [Planctomycetota bacterium]